VLAFTSTDLPTATCIRDEHINAIPLLDERVSVRSEITLSNPNWSIV